MYVVCEHGPHGIVLRDISATATSNWAGLAFKYTRNFLCIWHGLGSWHVHLHPPAPGSGLLGLRNTYFKGLLLIGHRATLRGLGNSL